MKTLGIILLAALLTGCGSDSEKVVTEEVSTTVEVKEQNVSVQIDEPVIAVGNQIVEITIQSSDIESNATTLDTEGIHAFKYNIDSNGGSIEVSSVFKALDTDTLDFIVSQEIDGTVYEIGVPTVMKSGNLIFVDKLVYIPENDDNTSNEWTINIQYFGDVIETVGSFTIEQEGK